MSASIIIALDFADQAAAMQLIDQLDPKDCRLKIGHEMFTAFGFPFVRQVMSLGFEVFLDLKFHDIPNTVAAACRKVAELNVWMTNVHGLGGLTMLRAAKQAIDDVGANTQLIAVTLLTSHNPQDLAGIGLNGTVENHVKILANLAQEAQLDGIVCSALDIQKLKISCDFSNDFTFVTPGIRPAWAAANDQQRIMTPVAAQQAGAHHLVIGRPITANSQPLVALQTIKKELESVS